MLYSGYFIVHVIPVLLRRNCEIGKSQRDPNPYGFNTPPKLKPVSKTKADIASLVYDLELIEDKKQGSERYILKKVEDFVRLLQD